MLILLNAHVKTRPTNKVAFQVYKYNPHTQYNVFYNYI